MDPQVDDDERQRSQERSFAWREVGQRQGAPLLDEERLLHQPQRIDERQDDAGKGEDRRQRGDPERACEEMLGSNDGRDIFRSLSNTIGRMAA